MARVAVVTGGTRGIGHAISIALSEKGFRVAANYGGNDKAAQQFQAETGIPVYKWNVGDYEACASGLKRVESEVGPVEVLVNNAGITRDAMLQKMTPEMWNEVIAVDLSSMFNMARPIIDGMRNRNWGRIINIGSINGQKGQMGQTQLFRRQGRHHRLHQGACPGNGAQGHHGQLHRAGLYRHRHGGGGSGKGPRKHHRPDPGRTARQSERDCPLRDLSGERRGGLHHRRDADHQWRSIYCRLTGCGGVDRASGASDAWRAPIFADLSTDSGSPQHRAGGLA